MLKINKKVVLRVGSLYVSNSLIYFGIALLTTNLSNAKKFNSLSEASNYASKLALNCEIIYAEN